MSIKVKDVTAPIEDTTTNLEMTSSFSFGEGLFQERSEVAQEIIGRKPDFFEKWALLAFLILLVLLTVGTWFISYPDILEGRAILKGTDAPKEIISKQTGKLTALFVQSSQSVKQGQILGWVESTAKTTEVLALSKALDSSIAILEKKRPDEIANLFKNPYSNLGELQMAYQAFMSSLLLYNDYLVNGFYTKRSNMLERDVMDLRSIKSKVASQQKITGEENVLAQATFDMNKKLFEEKVISVEEYRQAQSVLLSKRKADPQADINIIVQQNQIREKQKEIDQLNHDIKQQKQTFEQALFTLKSNVDDWLTRYTLVAPTDGVVVFAFPLQKNQYIEQGKVLGFVNPENSEYYAEIKISQTNFGKVDTGMKVHLRFDAYPYQESGFVLGTLDYISNIAVDSVFIGTVRLESGLKTSRAKPIQYKNGLNAQALIITKDMRLLERVYYSVVKSASVNK